MKDLIVSVADSYQEKVLEALLPRIPLSSGTAGFSFDIIVNPGHDPGCYNDSHELLRLFINQYRFAIVVFDFEGAGVEHLGKDIMASDVHKLLEINGWEGRNLVIVIEPELEKWLWMDNIHVMQAIGWERQESLYDWARKEGHLKPHETKPARPKEALELALRISETSKSASIYKKIAAHASYRRCEDGSFKQLIKQLQDWFPII
jgi:hypothetical protein